MLVNVNKISLRTPYWQTSIPSELGLLEDPHANYDSYKLFCLKSRFTPILHNIFKKTVDYRIYPQLQEDDLIHIYLDLVYKNEYIDADHQLIAHLQAQVDRITSYKSDHCILFRAIDLAFPDGHMISKGWVAEMLKMIKLDQQTYAYYKDDSIYGNLRNFTNNDNAKFRESYYELFTVLQAEISNTLLDMYEQGYVSNPPEHIITAWNLEPIVVTMYDPEDDQYIETDQKIYRARWFDQRILLNDQKMSDFIISRIEDNYNLSLDFPSSQYNWVVKHTVVKMIRYYFDIIDSIKFTDDYINVHINSNIGFNYDIVQKIINIIDSAKYMATGKVIFLSAKSTKIINIYHQIARQLDLDDIQIYQDDISSNVMTILTSIDTDTLYLEKLIIKQGHKIICGYSNI